VSLRHDQLIPVNKAVNKKEQLEKELEEEEKKKMQRYIHVLGINFSISYHQINSPLPPAYIDLSSTLTLLPLLWLTYRKGWPTFSYFYSMEPVVNVMI
jgi:hypothetical protein